MSNILTFYYVLQDLRVQQMSIQPAQISLVHLLMLLLTLGLGTTSLWWRQKRATVGSIKTRTTVCLLTYVFVMTKSAVGMMSAAASLGLSLLWDTDVGLSHVDKYTYLSEEQIKVWVLHLLLHSKLTKIHRQALSWPPGF